MFAWKVSRFSILTVITLLHYVNASMFYKICVKPVMASWFYDVLGCASYSNWEESMKYTFITIATTSVSIDLMSIAPTVASYAMPSDVGSLFSHLSEIVHRIRVNDQMR